MGVFLLNDFVEYCWVVLYWFGEDLQQVVFVILVNEDIQVFEFLQVFVDFVYLIQYCFVISVWYMQEVYVLVVQFVYCMDDVICGDGDMLYVGIVVVIQVFFNLRFFQFLSGFIDGKFDVVIVIGDYFVYQCGVFGGNVFIVEGY